MQTSIQTVPAVEKFFIRNGGSHFHEKYEICQAHRNRDPFGMVLLTDGAFTTQACGGKVGGQETRETERLERRRRRHVFAECRLA